jgi:hypothetical protein
MQWILKNSVGNNVRERSQKQRELDEISPAVEDIDNSEKKGGEYVEMETAINVQTNNIPFFER